MNQFEFNPASEKERHVFGACCPPLNSVRQWVSFMKDHGISRICCLLSKSEVDRYTGVQSLREIYHSEFGESNICWAPVKDFTLCHRSLLKETIIPFLKDSDVSNQRVVVHCLGGHGRTGHVLAAWLTWGRSFTVDEALETVIRMSRKPFEAVRYGSATEKELRMLLTPDEE